MLTANRLQLCQDACRSSTWVDARPHCRLMPPFQRTPAIIRTNFIFPETKVPKLYDDCYSIGLSVFNLRNYFRKPRKGVLDER